MQPNQQPNPGQPSYAPPTGGPNNPYEFILTPTPQQNKSPGLPKVRGKLPVIIGILLAILVLLLVLTMVVNKGGEETTDQLASLSAEQQEIIRISDLALKLSKDSNTLATATTVKASLSSEQKTALQLLGDQGGKLEKGQINSKLSKKTETNLNSAAQSNTIDQAYNDYLKTSLVSYQNNLKILYSSGGPKTKAFADKAYISSGYILTSL